MKNDQYAQAVFPMSDWKDLMNEFIQKGFCPWARAKLPTGSIFPVYFATPEYIMFNLKMQSRTETCASFSEPGLIVVDRIAIDVFDVSIESAWRNGFFEHLRPLDTLRINQFDRVDIDAPVLDSILSEMPELARDARYEGFVDQVHVVSGVAKLWVIPQTHGAWIGPRLVPIDQLRRLSDVR